MLEVRDVEAGYGDVQVLWGVELEVRPAEIVALVGANGAGKSTLLRVISGMIPTGDGQVLFEGDEIQGMAPEHVVRRGIAHVPEGRRLFAGLTVRENLMMGAFHRRDEEIEADLDRVITMFPKLGDRIGQVAGHMSGGEQQMCAIARGLMSRPRLIMIDELSLGLAPNLVDMFLERLPALTEDGTAVLLVEQDVDAALDVAERAYVLESGSMLLSGPSAELRDDARVQQAYLGITPDDASSGPAPSGPSPAPSQT